MRFAWAALLIAVVTTAFLALFAWDHERDYPDGETSGPYGIGQAGPMVGLVFVLTVGATRRGMPLLPTLVVPPVLAGWFAWDWSKTDESGLYVLGVILLGIGSFLGGGPCGCPRQELLPHRSGDRQQGKP